MSIPQDSHCPSLIMSSGLPLASPCHPHSLRSSIPSWIWVLIVLCAKPKLSYKRDQETDGQETGLKKVEILCVRYLKAYSEASNRLQTVHNLRNFGSKSPSGHLEVYGGRRGSYGEELLQRELLVQLCATRNSHPTLLRAASFTTNGNVTRANDSGTAQRNPAFTSSPRRSAYLQYLPYASPSPDAFTSTLVWRKFPPHLLLYPSCSLQIRDIFHLLVAMHKHYTPPNSRWALTCPTPSQAILLSHSRYLLSLSVESVPTLLLISTRLSRVSIVIALALLASLLASDVTHPSPHPSHPSLLGILDQLTAYSPPSSLPITSLDLSATAILSPAHNDKREDRCRALDGENVIESQTRKGHASTRYVHIGSLLPFRTQQPPTTLNNPLELARRLLGSPRSDQPGLPLTLLSSFTPGDLPLAMAKRYQLRSNGPATEDASTAPEPHEYKRGLSGT
ncbi:hypothetical protein NMY22_g9627 [Coprinellus aureogranulatus]|nr:hypothetical protein NMY22_g9627 [Coprinellus aureogranulatus]